MRRKQETKAVRKRSTEAEPSELGMWTSQDLPSCGFLLSALDDPLCTSATIAQLSFIASVFVYSFLLFQLISLKSLCSSEFATLLQIHGLRLGTHSSTSDTKHFKIPSQVKACLDCLLKQDDEGPSGCGVEYLSW